MTTDMFAQEIGFSSWEQLAAWARSRSNLRYSLAHG